MPDASSRSDSPPDSPDPAPINIAGATGGASARSSKAGSQSEIDLPAVPPPVSAVPESRPEGAVPRRFLRFSLPSLAVAGGLGVLELARARFQHRHMFAPTAYPDGNWDPASAGLAVDDVWLKSEDGTDLHGWWIPHPASEDSSTRPAGLPDHGLASAGERMTVVYCHGNKGNMAGRVDIFKALQRLGINIFAFDYRGYGRSKGTPSEAGVGADARAVLDYTVETLGVPWHRIILFGHSLGGAVAIAGAARRPQIAGLVVQSSFTQMTDMARHFFPEIPVHWIARNGFRSVKTIADLHMPKLIIHGGEDPTIPFEHGQRLFEAASEPKTWLPVARAGHNDLHQKGGLRYLTYLVRFRRQAQRHGAAAATATAASESADSE